MTDITIFWNQTHGDWRLVGPVLATGDDLSTAVIISLFTDRVAMPDDAIPDGSSDPRGWWGDDAAVPIGSRLWLIFRSKRTQDTLTKAQAYAEEALQWMVDDGVIADSSVEVEWQAPSTLAMRVTLFKNDGTTQALAFGWVWNGVN
jgi:phage gp46-like protein